MEQEFYSVSIYGRPADTAVSNGSVALDAAAQEDTGAGDGLEPPYLPQSLDKFEKALYEVAGKDGLASSPALLGGERLGIRVSVEAKSASEALYKVMDFYRHAARRAYGADPAIDEVESVEQEEFERREERRSS